MVLPLPVIGAAAGALGLDDVAGDLVSNTFLGPLNDTLGGVLGGGFPNFSSSGGLADALQSATGAQLDAISPVASLATTALGALANGDIPIDVNPSAFLGQLIGGNITQDDRTLGGALYDLLGSTADTSILGNIHDLTGQRLRANRIPQISRRIVKLNTGWGQLLENNLDIDGAGDTIADLLS